jgi:hypothetical protein
MLLPLFLCRKKKQDTEEAVEGTNTRDPSIEREGFISEFGLSDPGELDGGSDDEDLPGCVSNEPGNWREGNDLHGSEHNPDDLEDFNASADEA